MDTETQRVSGACLVSPNPADAQLAVSLFAQNGIQARPFGSLRQLAPVLDETAGCLILVEEALLAEGVPVLQEALHLLPAWCDLPLIAIAHDVGALGRVMANAFPNSGNVSLLERPLNPHTLLSAVRVALRASARQRQVAELLADRERAVEQRDEFIAMLAHELRNPLAPMRNALYLLRPLGRKDATVAKSVGILERQVSHMVRMVDDLLDIARLERGKLVLKKQPLDLNQVVAAAAENCLQFAQERGHHISVHFSAEAVPIHADPVRIEQIVCNLVNNAVKFSPGADEVRVETVLEPGHAVVRVIDQGAGFEPQAAETLFDPFQQAHQTLERGAGGLGMGLTIVRRLAELHDGSVHAHSDGPGKGSRFVVRLPLAASAPMGTAQAEPAPVVTRPKRVAVIEDNPDIRETMRMLLALWGHQVTMAGDGPSGVDLVLRERPDLALIDVGLPGMDGYAVACAIRKSLPGAGIRLIAVTGYGQPADRERALQAGFDTHLLKPISPDLLERLLAE